jgi:hypothetical protein
MSSKYLSPASFLATIAAVWTKAPYLPTDRPAHTERISPKYFAIKVFHDKNLRNVTPAKIALSSGTPDLQHLY